MKSSNERLKERRAALAIPGAKSGKVTRRKVSRSSAYKSIAACSKRGSKEAIRALTVTTTNEIQNITWAITMVQNPGFIPNDKNIVRSEAPITISGVAIGKKIRKFVDDLP